MAAPLPSGITTPNDLAVAMRYGPQTEQALRRSSYLADALRELNTSGSQNIHSTGELAAKLLASAILSRGTNKSQDAVMSAMRADQGDETSRLLAGLGAAPTGAPSLPTGAAPAVDPQPPTPQPEPQAPAPQAPPPQPAPQQPTGANYTPQDHDALTRMLATEAIGEGPDGMTAAAHVALNRLKAGYGGAKSLSDVVYQPHQFEGISRANQVSPQDYAHAGQVADQVLSGQAPDPTGGAMAFLNPDLQRQLGRQIPAWAQGEGHRIGRHVFFGGNPQLAQNTAQPPSAPPPPNPNGPDVQDVGSQGAGANPLPPSAPGVSPPVAGTAPAGPHPQAASPAGATANPWPNWTPSPEERTHVERLLNDPRYHAQGVQEVLKMQEKMTQPVEAQITMINGMPFYVPKDPTSGTPSVAIPVPQGALTKIQTAEQLGVSAPHGTAFNVDPLGNAKPLIQPSTGQQVTSQPGQPYAEHFIPGSEHDPTRPQAPQQGFRYAGGNPTGAQEAIPGSGQDPHSPMNLAQGTQAVQNNLRSTIDLAVVAKQSVGAVHEGYKQQNGTGDIAMVNGLQHLIDKGVVRGEDVNMQMKSNGIAGGLGAVTQYINSNGLLTPDVRNKVLQAANALYGNIDQQYRAQVMGHRSTVDAIYGPGAFDKYVVPAEQQQSLGWADSHGVASPPPPPTPMNQPHLTSGTRDAAIAEARRRGLIH